MEMPKLSLTGKIIVAKIAAALGDKYVNSKIDRLAEASGGGAHRGSKTVEKLSSLPSDFQDKLIRLAFEEDRRGFMALLDAEGCPPDMSLRTKLWHRMGGE